MDRKMSSPVFEPCQELQWSQEANSHHVATYHCCTVEAETAANIVPFVNCMLGSYSWII